MEENQDGESSHTAIWKVDNHQPVIRIVDRALQIGRVGFGTAVVLKLDPIISIYIALFFASTEDAMIV